MINSTLIFLLASLFGATSLWLILPGQGWSTTPQRRITLGAMLGMSCLGLYVSQLPGVGGLATGLVYYPLAGITLFAATATISSRNLVHSAAWFSMLVLSVSVLFLLDGIPWLAVVNMVVHSTVLFAMYRIVLPSTTAHGRAVHDLKSHESFLSAATGAVIVGVLTAAIGGAPIEKSALVHNYLVLGAMLFGIGLVGFLSRRNMILILLAIEILLQGISLSLVAWSRCHNDFGGETMVAVILLVAGCEAAVALIVIRFLLRRRGRLDIMPWQQPGEEKPMPTGRQDG